MNQTVIRGSRRRTLTHAALVLTLGLALMASAAAMTHAATIDVMYTPELGTFLVGDGSMTLYLFTPDSHNHSVCYGGCAVIWPPMLVDSLDDLEVADNIPGTFGIAERTDGTKQVTYNGIPLYYWIVDKQPGDVTGQGVDDAWYVVNPTPTVQVHHDEEHGDILVDALGMTLYIFGRDEENISNCSGTCAINWPPLIVSYGEPVAGPGLQGKLSLITREDGARQVTYNGQPLYGWIADQKPGDTTGHGVGGNWFVVSP